MDVAKQLIKEGLRSGRVSSDLDVPNAIPSKIIATELRPLSQQTPFVVISDIQTKGRGTSGRSWNSSSDLNLSMSLAIPYSLIPSAVLPVLPLVVGLSARSCIEQAALQQGADAKKVNDVKLKWPNDLLCADKKVLGALIEHEDSHLVVGVGINVGSVPSVDTSDGSREATSLRNHFADDSQNFESSPWKLSPEALGISTCTEIMRRLGSAEHLADSEARRVVIDEFSSHMAMNITLRKRMTGSAQRGAEVIPIGLNSWGHLRVKNVDTGSEETLSSEYLH